MEHGLGVWTPKITPLNYSAQNPGEPLDNQVRGKNHFGFTQESSAAALLDVHSHAFSFQINPGLANCA
jgi:hypothetical protein